MRVLIVDDQVLFREGLVSMLNGQDDITVVGEAGCVREAIEKATELQPNIVLMDLILADGDGLEAMKSILANHPEIKVVILTIQDSDDMLILAFFSGARGYLLKSMPVSKIIVALRAVERGELAFSRSMTSRLLDELMRFAAVRDHFHFSLKSLTPRELEVLKHVGSNATNREISRRLFIAENTVKIHTHNIYEKLRLKNRDEAIKFAQRAGLVESNNNHEV
jgi:two-component system NarL family response regulator